VSLKSRLILPLLSCLLVCFLSGVASPDDQTSEIMNGIRDRYGNAGGLAADYTREAISKTMALLETAQRHDVATGRLYFKPPHCLRLEQTSPREELLLTDGQTLWWYIPFKAEAYRYPAKRFGRELSLLSDVLKGLKDSEDKFRITSREDPEALAHHLFLNPEPPWQDIDHLEVRASKRDFAINQVDIYNTIGGLTRFVLDGWQENKQFEADFFSFSPPPHIRIIEQ